MKRFKQVVTLFTAVTMAASLFAGCGASKDNSSAASSAVASSAAATSAASTVAEDPYKDPVELSVALWSIGEALVDGQDPVRDALYKKLNITIKPMNITWSDYKNKVVVWAASSQLPDMFAYDAVGYSIYSDWVKQGIVKQIPDDVSAYPNIANIMKDTGTSIYQYPVGDASGKYYAIPRLNHKVTDEWSCDVGALIRTDWMTNVGVTKDPETMDEYVDLMVKFASNDPDKNGKKDTIGMTCYDATKLNYILSVYEPCYENWARDPENAGQWIPGWMTKNFLAGVQALNKLYTSGGLDKDFANHKGEEGEDKFANGKAGVYSHDVTPSTLVYLANKYEKINPGKKFEDVIKILRPLKNAAGTYSRFVAIPSWSETYFNAKIDDTKMKRGMALLEYYMTDEGYNLTHYGIEGTDYTKDSSGKVTLITHTDAAGVEIPLTTTYPMTKVGFFSEWSGTRQWTGPSQKPALQKMSKDQNDWLIANAKPQDTDLRIGYLDIPSKEKSTVQLKDVIVKCILSKNVEKTWSDEVAAAKANGMAIVIKDTNAAIVKAGIK